MLKNTLDSYSKKCREWRKLWVTINTLEIYLILKLKLEFNAKNVGESSIRQQRLSNLLFLLLLALLLRKEHQ